MNRRGNFVVSLVLLAVCVADPASAQSQAVTTIGTCVVIQTNAVNVEVPVPLRAAGSCDTGDPGTRECTTEVVPTAPDIVLDVSDTGGLPACMRLAGEDPCAFVQNGPVIFQSPRL